MDIINLTRKISALRAMTAPDSITPEVLGSLLQQIADLIGALNQIDTSEATDLITRVSAAEANAETARQAAQNALTASEANVIDSFSFDQTSTVLQLSLKQHGHDAVLLNLPGATTTFAGILTATDKYHLDVAYNKYLRQLTTSSYADRVTLNYKRHDDTVTQVTFVGATTLEAGLMTAADKSKLASIDSTVQQIQEWRQTVTTFLESRVPLISTENGRIGIGYEYPTLLFGMGADLDGPDAGSCPLGGCYWDPDTNQIWNRVQPRVSVPIDPSPSVVYTNFYTGKKYAWIAGQVPGEGEMVEVSDLPAIVNDTITGGASKILAAQQGVVLHQETELNKARYRNLCQAIKSSSSFSDLKNYVNSASWNTYNPLILHLTGCTLQEEVPSYFGPLDSGTQVKVKAKAGYELSVNSVTIYDGNGVSQDHDITHEIFSDGCIQYDASTGLLLIILEDPDAFEIFINATKTES
jgi:hypothetical protein